jgi:membrane protease YdiL (CAAX protease family)
MTSPPQSPTPLRRLFSSPDGRLRAGWRLLGQMVLLFTFLMIFGIPLGILIIYFPDLPMQALLLLNGLTLFLAINASVYLARRLLDRRSFGSLGLRWNAWAVRDLIFGILLTGAMMGLIFLIEWAAGWLTFESFAWENQNWGYVIAGTLVSALAFIMVGWHEELISRGYWLQNLTEGLNIYWALAISSGLFSLAHIANPNASTAAIVGLFLSGLFLAYGFLRTGQLWLSIGLHTGWNFFEGVVFGFPVSGSEFFRLVNHTVRGPELVTGGAFGPEAGLVLLPSLVLGTILIHLYTRNRTKQGSKG